MAYLRFKKFKAIWLVPVLLILALVISCGAAAEKAAPAPVDTEAIIQTAVQQALAAAPAASSGVTSEEVQQIVEAAVLAARPGEADFYEGKTIRLLVGFSAGGGYDTYGRAIARHIGKHIPGNPTVIVENMTGAGSVIAANYIYNQAKPDGLTLGLWNSNNLLIQALRGNPGIQFSGERYGWIAAPSDGNPVCGVMGFTGLKTWDDLVNASKEGRELKFGATAAFGASLSDVPLLINKFGGTNFKIVSGYRGTSKIRLALEEKEVDVACWGWESMGITARHLLDAEGDGKLIPVAMVFPAPGIEEIADLPLMGDVITDEKDRALWDTWAGGYKFQRPWTTPPGTPEVRIEILRQAFAATMKDPGFLSDAKKAGLYLNPVSGDEVVGYVAGTLQMSQSTCKAMQFMVLDRGEC